MFIGYEFGAEQKIVRRSRAFFPGIGPLDPLHQKQVI